MMKKKNCEKLLDKSMKQNACNDLFIINKIENKLYGIYTKKTYTCCNFPFLQINE